MNGFNKMNLNGSTGMGQMMNQMGMGMQNPMGMGMQNPMGMPNPMPIPNPMPMQMNPQNDARTRITQE